MIGSAADKDFASDKISQLSRAIGFALAAATIVFLTSESAFAKNLVGTYKVSLLIVSGLGCVTIVFDWLQFVFGFYASQKAFENKEQHYAFDVRSFSYRARWKMFYWKQVTATVGAIGYILILIADIVW